MGKSKFPLTTSAISISVKELRKIFRITNIVVQVLLIAYYGFMIYQSSNHIIRLIAYSVLTGISLVAFTLELILESQINDDETIERRKVRKHNKRVRKLFYSCIKYSTRLTILVVAIISIAKYEASTITTITTILSAVLILANIIIDAITYLVLRYIKLLRIGFITDMQGGGVVPALIRKFTKDVIDYDEGLGELNDAEKEMLTDLEKEAEAREQEKDKKIVKKRGC